MKTRIQHSITTLLRITALVSFLVGPVGAFAFAYWGGDFYIFTAPLNGKTTITRYRPTDGTLKVVGSVPQAVVGAGVSTCTPSKS